jgi:hypothetical protein
MTFAELEAIYPDAAIFMDIEVTQEHPNHSIERPPDTFVGSAALSHLLVFKNLPRNTILLISPGCGDWQVREEHANVFCTCWYYDPEGKDVHWKRMPSNIHRVMCDLGDISERLAKMPMVDPNDYPSQTIYRSRNNSNGYETLLRHTETPPVVPIDYTVVDEDE